MTRKPSRASTPVSTTTAPSPTPPCASSKLPRRKSTNQTTALGFGAGGGLVALELKQEISVVFDDELHVFAFAVEGVAGDHGVAEINFLIEPLGCGELALGFGGFAFGFFGGDGDRDGRTAFVLAQSEREQKVADVFAVEGERTWQRAVVGGEPGVEGVGEVVRV